ncbi:MAG: hypothetical protein JWP69_2238 [Flaviaesturariibacter sp.]|nr:hypothetical protein [Flaviaesturariibacter sp.]
MNNRNDNSGDNGRQSPQDKAVQNPDEWKTGSEALTEVQQANLHTQPERKEQNSSTGGEDEGAK